MPFTKRGRGRGSSQKKKAKTLELENENAGTELDEAISSQESQDELLSTEVAPPLSTPVRRSQRKRTLFEAFSATPVEKKPRLKKNPQCSDQFTSEGTADDKSAQSSTSAIRSSKRLRNAKKPEEEMNEFPICNKSDVKLKVQTVCSSENIPAEENQETVIPVKDDQASCAELGSGTTNELSETLSPNEDESVSQKSDTQFKIQMECEDASPLEIVPPEENQELVIPAKEDLDNCAYVTQVEPVMDHSIVDKKPLENLNQIGYECNDAHSFTEKNDNLKTPVKDDQAICAEQFDNETTSELAKVSSQDETAIAPKLCSTSQEKNDACMQDEPTTDSFALDQKQPEDIDQPQTDVEQHSNQIDATAQLLKEDVHDKQQVSEDMSESLPVVTQEMKDAATDSTRTKELNTEKDSETIFTLEDFEDEFMYEDIDEEDDCQMMTKSHSNVDDKKKDLVGSATQKEEKKIKLEDEKASSKKFGKVGLIGSPHQRTLLGSLHIPNVIEVFIKRDLNFKNLIGIIKKLAQVMPPDTLWVAFPDIECIGLISKSQECDHRDCKLHTMCFDLHKSFNHASNLSKCIEELNASLRNLSDAMNETSQLFLPLPLPIEVIRCWSIEHKKIHDLFTIHPHSYCIRKRSFLWTVRDFYVSLMEKLVDIPSINFPCDEHPIRHYSKKIVSMVKTVNEDDATSCHFERWQSAMKEVFSPLVKDPLSSCFPKPLSPIVDEDSAAIPGDESVCQLNDVPVTQAPSDSVVKLLEEMKLASSLVGSLNMEFSSPRIQICDEAKPEDSAPISNAQHKSNCSNEELTDATSSSLLPNAGTEVKSENAKRPESKDKESKQSNDRSRRSRSKSRRRSRQRNRSRSRDRSRFRSRSRDRNRFRSRSKSKDRKRFRLRSRSKNRNRFRSRSRSKNRNRLRSRSKLNDRSRRRRSRSVSKSRNRRYRSRSNSKSRRGRHRSRSNSTDRSRSRRKSRSRERSGRGRSRSKSKEREKIRSRSCSKEKTAAVQRPKSRDRSVPKAMPLDEGQKPMSSSDSSQVTVGLSLNPSPKETPIISRPTFEKRSGIRSDLNVNQSFSTSRESDPIPFDSRKRCQPLASKDQRERFDPKSSAEKENENTLSSKEGRRHFRSPSPHLKLEPRSKLRSRPRYRSRSKSRSRYRSRSRCRHKKRKKSPKSRSPSSLSSLSLSLSSLSSSSSSSSPSPSPKKRRKRGRRSPMLKGDADHSTEVSRKAPLQVSKLKEGISTSPRISSPPAKASVDIKEVPAPDPGSGLTPFASQVDKSTLALAKEFIEKKKSILERVNKEYTIYSQVPEMHAKYKESYDAFLEKYNPKFGDLKDENHKAMVFSKYWEVALDSFKTLELQQQMEGLKLQIKQKVSPPTSKGASEQTPKPDSTHPPKPDSTRPPKPDSTRPPKPDSTRSPNTPNGEGFSVSETMHLLDQVKTEVGALQPAIMALVEEYNRKGQDGSASLAIFQVPENKLALQMVLDKVTLKMTSSNEALKTLFKNVHDKLSKLIQSLKVDAKEDLEPPSTTLDLKTIAKVTLGRDRSSILDIIKTGLAYEEGIMDPPRDLLDNLLLQVISIQSKMPR